MEQRPFAHLQERIRQEVDAFARMHVGPSLTVRRPCDIEAGVRTAAEECLASVVGDLDQPDRIANIAFDHPDANVRGAGWWSLAGVWERSTDRQALIDLFCELLGVRFKINADAFVLRTAAAAWLEAVASEASSVSTKISKEDLSAAHMHRYAGDDKRAIEASTAGAARFLDHANPHRKLAAIAHLARTAPKTPWVRERIREMALGDPDRGVREAALVSLGTLYYDTRDRAILKLLASVTASEMQPARLRFLAYDALFVVLGRPHGEWPMPRAMLESKEAAVAFLAGSEEWPGDVDWTLVASALGPQS